MKRLIFLVSCLLLLGSTPTVAQTVTSEAVSVRVQELGLRIYITTARGTAEPETEELKTEKKESYAQLAARTYQRLLASYQQQGYTLQAVVPGPRDKTDAINTFLFTKVTPKP